MEVDPLLQEPVYPSRKSQGYSSHGLIFCIPGYGVTQYAQLENLSKSHRLQHLKSCIPQQVLVSLSFAQSCIERHLALLAKVLHSPATSITILPKVWLVFPLRELLHLYLICTVGRRSSDRQLTRDCGILDMLQSGGSIVADKGFEIESDLAKVVSLNIPPFLRDK